MKQRQITITHKFPEEWVGGGEQLNFCDLLLHLLDLNSSRECAAAPGGVRLVVSFGQGQCH